MGRPFERLAMSPRGAALLVGVGATAGAAVALSIVYVGGRFWIGPWLDALPNRDTEMFGPPEGWLVAFATILLGPPTVIVAAWLGIGWARRWWAIDRVRPAGVRFTAGAFVFGLFSLGALDPVGTAGGLVVVSIAIGVAGFLASVTARSEPASTDE